MIADLIDRGYSQAEIARRIALGHWTLSRWAAGKFPKKSHAALLALADMHKTCRRKRKPAKVPA